MIWQTFLMAFGEIRRNTMRSILTALGIVIGVASVIAMVTIGQGATLRITRDIASLGTNLLIVAPGAERHGPTSNSAPALTLEDTKAIEREVGVVELVAPSATRAVLIVYGARNWSSTATGTTNEYFQIRGYTVSQGETFSEAQLGSGMAVCVLGETVRRELFGKADPIGATIRVAAVSCTVIGVLASKGKSTFGQDQDDFVVLPLGAFQRRIAGNKDVGAIFVQATSDRSTVKAKVQMEELLRERRRIAPGQTDDFQVADMKEITTTLSTVTGALTALLGAIAGVSLLVGGIGIMNIMLVSVTERTREIGIRLAIGARASEVLVQFLVEAVVLSALGGLLGIVSGLGLSYGACVLLNLPFTVAPQIVLIAFAFSTVVGVTFGYFPARKAAHLNPIEALRHE